MTQISAIERALGADPRTRAERRIGLLLLDEDAGLPADAAFRALAALIEAGCAVTDIPADGRALARRLWSGAGDMESERETLPLPDYMRWFSSLPQAIRDGISSRWKSPEADPLFRPGALDCGHFAVPATRCGMAAIGLWTTRALPAADRFRTPPHGHLAVLAWLRDVFRAQAILVIGADGGPTIAPPPF